MSQVITETGSIFDLHFEINDSSDGSDDGKFSNRQHISNTLLQLLLEQRPFSPQKEIRKKSKIYD